MTINLDRAKFLNYLRLILFALIVICYFKSICSLFKNFNEAVIPLAKSHFHFIQPAAISGETDICDFTTFYASGLLNKERLISHQDIDVYDPILLTQTIERLIAPMQSAAVYSIQYPPMLFALTTPLAWLDLYTAWRIWLFVSAICLAITFLCVTFDALKTKPWLAAGLFIYFVNAAVVQMLLVGQTTAFEAAIIAISFRLLINKKYFWAGVIAGFAFLKLQQVLIILIPGICLGKRNFAYGCLLTIILEGFLSAYLVGYNNILHFLEANYLSEITHSYIGLNEVFTMSNFRSVLNSCFGGISQASSLAFLAYIICCAISIWLWMRIYPILQVVSEQAFALVASLSTTLLVYFSLHGYLYDFLLLVFPILWLYIWSTSNDRRYAIWQTFIRSFIALFTFALPFLLWTILDLTNLENTEIGYAIRTFFGITILLICAITAISIELKPKKPNFLSN